MFTGKVVHWVSLGEFWVYKCLPHMYLNRALNMALGGYWLTATLAGCSLLKRDERAYISAALSSAMVGNILLPPDVLVFCPAFIVDTGGKINLIT